MNIQAPRDFIDRRQLVSALRALRRGDFTVRLPEEVDGVDGEIASIFNEVVSLNEEMTQEFERLSKVVGKEGKITQRGRVKNARGGWETAIRSVNELIEDMVQPTAEVSRVIGAVAKGDLSQSMTVEIDGRPLRGEFLRIGRVVNTMVDQLNGFASEVTRVAREVGTEGKLGGQARVKGVAGTWKDLTDNVNAMATNLTGQVRNIAEVTTAVARGDLSKKITVEVKGEILELKNTINTMVDQLNGFASEVTRVAREVGTEGKLGGQARVEGVAGTWKDLTDNVNLMADNLTGQVRNIAEVTTAVAKGDLSKKITVDVKGEILELKNTINTMVDQLNGFASEVTRVAREVGTEGKLGGQAQVPGVGGTWKDLTDNVNQLANNLTGQVRNIAEVTTAIARGDLSKKITVDVKGEILELKDTINTMVDQLNSFASEVTRVAREVGSEGKLGGQAQVEGVAGTWADLTDNVNLMAEQSDRPGAQHRRGDDRRRQGRFVEENHRRRQRRNPRAQEHHQHHGRSAELVRFGSDPRRARSGLGRQARRPGAGRRRRRNLGRLDRQREPDGRQSDRPGAQHRRRDDRRRQGRPVAQDHGRREGRNPRAQEHHQHHGRPAQRLRLGSDPRRARSRHRRQARRPGAGAGRRRHLEGPDRQRQRHGREPDRPGPQHRRGDDRGGAGRPFQEDHRRREGRDPRAQEHHQHDGRPAQRLRVRSDARRARGRHRRQARRTGAGARRRRHVEGPHRQREPDGREPDRPGAQHRRRDHRRRARRLVEEDHRRGEGRNPPAQEHHQRHGRPAERLRSRR